MKSKMNISGAAKRRIAGGWVVLAAAVAVFAQGPGRAFDAAGVVRDLRDPNSGAYWVLVRNADNPAGPGRLFLLAAKEDGATNRSAAVAPAIRAGDRLVVEEETAVARARLSAVALTGAAAGQELAVRLTIGGRVVRVVARAPGRAAFLSGAKVRP